jgi:chitin synthase
LRSSLSFSTTLSCEANIRAYTLFCSFFLVGLAFSRNTFPHADTFGAFLRAFFTSINGLITIALISTYGVYLVASLLYFDPWHMVTSFVQYQVMATSYINILNVYAFCNWHDVSWGTKGSDKADALPSMHTKKQAGQEGDASVEIEEYELPQTEVDSKFEKVVKRALAPYKEPEKKNETSLDDSYKNFRTRLLILWIFSNVIVVLVISSNTLSGHFGFETDLQAVAEGHQSDAQKRTAAYFQIILWATAMLAVVRYYPPRFALMRFTGCLFYLGKVGVLFCCRRK